MNRSLVLKISAIVILAAAPFYLLSQRNSSSHVIYDSGGISKLDSAGGGLEDYYYKARGLADASGDSTASFIATGDIMLSRSVAGTIKKAGEPLLPFSGMSAILESADFSLGNLESPVSGSDHFNPSGSLVFNAPPAYTQGLVKYKFEVLSLANNHALDQGAKGLKNTMAFLKQEGIKHIGTGENQEEAWQPAVTEHNGIKICFIGASYASINDNGKTRNDYVARIEDGEKLNMAVSKAESICDFIVVGMHAGTEYTHTPSGQQTGFARRAIDAGADMVIGHHPHWVQTIEKYQGKYIFYSLGNFIFDQEWSQKTKEGLVLKVRVKSAKQENPAASGAAGIDDLQGNRLKAELDSVELLPVIIENYSTPRLATEEESKKILESIGQQEKVLR